MSVAPPQASTGAMAPVERTLSPNPFVKRPRVPPK
jgi:hypothetical protein